MGQQIENSQVQSTVLSERLESVRHQIRAIDQRISSDAQLARNLRFQLHQLSQPVEPHGAYSLADEVQFGPGERQA